MFQIAGPEAPGLLAEITELLSHNGLEIRTAAVSDNGCGGVCSPAAAAGAACTCL